MLQQHLFVIQKSCKNYRSLVQTQSDLLGKPLFPENVTGVAYGMVEF